jgi:hypothetical protein
MNSQIAERFTLNVARVRHLVSTYDTTTGTGRGRRSVKDGDILRAAVVLLHASVEDVLRSLERRTLPRSSAEVLNEIPLAGTKAEKFSLGQLSRYRGKTVEQVIDESVAQSLERATYNNAGDMAAVLKRLGADSNAFTAEIGPVANMMRRRHDIVHRADRDESAGSGHHGASAIAKSQVEEWVNAVEILVSKIFGAVPDLDGNAP